MKIKNKFSQYGVPEDGISEYEKLSDDDKRVVDENIQFLEENGFGRGPSTIKFNKKLYTLEKCKKWLKKRNL